ncbi:MAG: cation transporter [Clostridia bacterium]|nr:cation transporter [Clostridia bacterium]
MTDFLVKRFVKRSEQVHEPDVRSAYGKVAGATGIVVNLLLFAGKLLAGLLTGALSVIGDAVNNLSDAASSLVTLLGFKLSEAPPDDQHPFGHGRMEYLSGMGIGVLILFAGWELLKSSFTKILHPEPTAWSYVTLGILLAAVLVKGWLMLFYRKLGKRISSDTLLAASVDSRNDMLCTVLIAASIVVEYFTGWQIDGYMGVLVAALIVWAGISVIRDSVSPLLGQAPDPEMVREIRKMALSYDGIVGVHDLIIHNYGPGRVIISLHAEVPADEDVLKSHDLVDRLEHDMMQRFHAVTCIHLDPVDTANPEVQRLKILAETALSDIDKSLTLHDFRVVFGETHTNVIFDITVPFDYKDEASLGAEIQRRLQMTDPKLMVVAQPEHSYT